MSPREMGAVRKEPGVHLSNKEFRPHPEGPALGEAGLYLTQNTQLEEDILNQRVLCFQERFLEQALSPLP